MDTPLNSVNSNNQKLDNKFGSVIDAVSASNDSRSEGLAIIENINGQAFMSGMADLFMLGRGLGIAPMVAYLEVITDECGPPVELRLVSYRLPT